MTITVVMALLLAFSVPLLLAFPSLIFGWVRRARELLSEVKEITRQKSALSPPCRRLWASAKAQSLRRWRYDPDYQRPQLFTRVVTFPATALFLQFRTEFLSGWVCALLAYNLSRWSFRSQANFFFVTFYSVWLPKFRYYLVLLLYFELQKKRTVEEKLFSYQFSLFW